MRFDQIRVGSSPIAGVLVRIGIFGQRRTNRGSSLEREAGRILCDGHTKMHLLARGC